MAGGDGWLVAFVLAAAACILAAPLLGRSGWPVAADAAMILAGVCGVSAFALAARDTLRAARRAPPPDEPGPDAPHTPDRGAERRQQP